MSADSWTAADYAPADGPRAGLRSLKSEPGTERPVCTGLPGGAPSAGALDEGGAGADLPGCLARHAVMFHRHVELYLHFIWSTWDRVPWITEAMQPRLHAVLCSIAREHGCSFVVAGGVSEHVHVLVRAPPTSCPADLVRHLKGVSSHFAHQELAVDPSCRWSQGYALFSADSSALIALTAYIDSQARHHSAGTTEALVGATDVGHLKMLSKPAVPIPASHLSCP